MVFHKKNNLACRNWYFNEQDYCLSYWLRLEYGFIGLNWLYDPENKKSYRFKKDSNNR